MFSSRHRIGESRDVTQLLQLPSPGVVFGSAYSCRTNGPAWLSRSAGILFPEKGEPVSGSTGTAGEQAGIRGALENPRPPPHRGTDAGPAAPPAPGFPFCALEE